MRSFFGWFPQSILEELKEKLKSEDEINEVERTDNKRYQDVIEPAIFKIAVMKLHFAFSLLKQYFNRIEHKRKIIKKDEEKLKRERENKIFEEDPIKYIKEILILEVGKIRTFLNKKNLVLSNIFREVIKTKIKENRKKN